MEKTQLCQGWKMRCVKDNGWQQAVIPGSVYTDLLRNGNMEDPFWKDNEMSACERMKEDYEYECTFIPEKTVLGEEKQFLHFDGLDTITTVSLNGEILGETISMHREWEFDVTDKLKEGENVLHILFHSPLKYIEEAYKKYGNIGNEDAMEGFMHIRKAHCMYGWDWGAHLPDAGIFRPVWLYGVTSARVDSVYVTQEHTENTVILHFAAEAVYTENTSAGTICEKDGFAWKVKVTAPDGTILDTELDQDGKGSLTVLNPQLWWPNGLGEQPLYQVEVTLEKQGVLCDTWNRRIGLRIMTVHREKDEWGESFEQMVNGQAFFAMGADYIPEDHLLGRRTPEKTRKLLKDCKLANFNSIRVWGGGFYPDDWFFDICDELGLVVWEDFMFACSVYELTPEFEANIRQEFIENVKRIRHHACLGLWCGNNEMESFVNDGCWVTKKTEVRDYLFMYERIIPEVLREYDPQTFYWPSSPSSGGSFDAPQDPNRGDVHYWEVWHGNKPFTEYRKYYFRYISEFGFQAFPAKKTIETFTDDPRDWNMFSYIMEKHQRNNSANGKIMNYMQKTYRYPESFDSCIYASQLLQADGIRYGTEHFRQNRGRCMGTVYWQLNDCWPVISWASIDYCGRWKALHYYAKRFFAPVLVSCKEESWMTQEADMNREHFEFEKSIQFNISNETRVDHEILVKWQIRNAKAEILREEQIQMHVNATSAVWAEKVLLPDIDVFNEYVSYQAYENGEKIADSTVIFSYPKYFRYENPHLSCKIEGDSIVVCADAYAKSVEILNENEDLVLSDNYFDLNAEERTVKILRGTPEGLKLRSVYDI
mgnify:CR=1 FL=1